MVGIEQSEPSVRRVKALKCLTTTRTFRLILSTRTNSAILALDATTFLAWRRHSDLSRGLAFTSGAVVQLS